MRIEITVPANLATLTALLEGLTIANMWLLRNHSQLPPLYQSGVRYKAEPPGEEKWEIATRVYAQGFGDCEDLAAWRAAELRLAGETNARAIGIKAGRKRRWHAVVKRADGTIEDPSRALGM